MNFMNLHAKLPAMEVYILINGMRLMLVHVPASQVTVIRHMMSVSTFSSPTLRSVRGERAILLGIIKLQLWTRETQRARVETMKIHYVLFTTCIQRAALLTICVHAHIGSACGVCVCVGGNVKMYKNK
jgi:hypothetical protein